MQKNKHGKMRFLVILVAVAISVIAITNSRGSISEEIQSQIYGNLKDVAAQNDTTIERLLEDRQQILLNIADEIEANAFEFTTEEEIWEVVEWLKNYNKLYDFKRMGIIATDGTTYTTDGFKQLIKDEPYQYGMQGLTNISSTLTEKMGVEEQVNVFSVPIFMKDGKTVKGILYATYRTENFRELLDINSFNDNGYSYIVQKDGTVIVGSEKSPMYGCSNVFDTMMAHSKDNVAIVERMRAAMWNRQSGYEVLYIMGERSLYYTPIATEHINKDWYLFTIVPTNVLNEKVESLIAQQDLLIFVVAITILCLVIYFVVTYRNDDKLLRNMAYMDALTGGNNMHAYREHLKSRKLRWGFVVSVDLSDFKLVNSVCGIEKGDEVIKKVWEIISTNVTDREFAAHGGGDHFVMYLQEVYQSHLLERLQQITEEVEAVSEELGIISIHPYFGIYEMRDIVDPEEAYNYANQAKKEVKGDKIKNVAFYDEINFKKIMDNKALVDSFKSAIEKEEFQIWYQPKFCGNTAKIVGAEALVRWRKSDGTVVSPGQFIPLFESNGMIITLDQYVFSKVCEQQKRWEREGVKIIPISVNISRASLYWGNIVNKYRDIARNYDIDLKMVPLEITESATIKNSQVKELVEKFRDAGFVLCLDDFGNGYSSLAMLNLIRFDVLKLDKALVDYIGDAHGEQLVKYTIRVAQGMGMHVVAEGVETLEQVEFLNAQGCDEIQGYFFSKPVALEKFTSMLVI